MLFSAALIVRNEEQYLEQCLASLQDLVDEIVVVDTGSTDRTKEIALEHAARVVDFTWCDDFAAARNHALSQAQGAWVLYIDADERARRGQAALLREMLKDPEFIAYTVQLYPHPTSTAYPELRIFRNDPRIRFRGRIHERIWPAIERYQSERGGRIGACGLAIDHEGYQSDQQRKHLRNLPLLRRELREDPSRVYCWCHLADIHAELGKGHSARRAWMKALEIVRRRQQVRPDDCLPYLGLAQWQFESQQDPQPLLQEGLRRFPTNLQLHWLQGKVLMASKRFEDAIPVFEYLIDCGKTGDFEHAISYDRRLLAELPLSHLAACHFELKDYAQSGRYFDLAAEIAPENLEYRVKRELCAMLSRTHGSAVREPESRARRS